jgi:hypothetical protein
MIDRKTALICAGLIALMFAAAFWGITNPEAWPAQMAWTRTLPPSMALFVPPAVCALFTGSLYQPLRWKAMSLRWFAYPCQPALRRPSSICS